MTEQWTWLKYYNNLVIWKTKLSEGWCPVCNTRFNRRRPDGELECEHGFSHAEMKLTVEASEARSAILGGLQVNQ